MRDVTLCRPAASQRSPAQAARHLEHRVEYRRKPGIRSGLDCLRSTADEHRLMHGYVAVPRSPWGATRGRWHSALAMTSSVPARAVARFRLVRRQRRENWLMKVVSVTPRADGLVRRASKGSQRARVPAGKQDYLVRLSVMSRIRRSDLGDLLITSRRSSHGTLYDSVRTAVPARASPSQAPGISPCALETPSRRVVARRQRRGRLPQLPHRLPRCGASW